MKEYGRYFIGVLVAIVTIVVLVLLFNLIKGVFNRGDDSQQTANKASFDLTDARTQGKALRYTVEGVINGQDQHREIRITVEPTSRHIEVLQGYNGQVIKSQHFDNTTEAYEAFVNALSGVSFTKTVPEKGRGIKDQSCPLGRRYVYEVGPGTSNNFYAWSTNCGRNLGTFTGSKSSVEQLFQRQIPNYSQFTNDVNLN